MLKQDIKDLSELQKLIEKTTRPEPSTDEYLTINSKVFQARLKGTGSASVPKYNEEIIDKGYDN